MDIIVFDIDGVLADCRHRLHHIKQKPPNWETFYRECEQDDLILPGAKLAQGLACDPTLRFVLCTGRAESTRQATTRWLKRQGLVMDLDLCCTPADLIMRPDGDYRKDYELKADMLETLRDVSGGQILLVVDDSLAVVDELVRRCFACLHFRWPGEKEHEDVRLAYQTAMKQASSIGPLPDKE